MFLNIFSDQNFCHLCELFLWMLGAFLVGYFFWRWRFRTKYKDEINYLREKYNNLEHEMNTTVKASKVTAPGVVDPAVTISSFVDGVAKASDVEKKEPAQSAATVVSDNRKDDLTKIEGIGPKIKGLLNDDGILSFLSLADATTERLQKILDAAGPRYRMHNPGTWPKQARLAAEDKWEELEKLQDSLKGGR